ncbi:MAG: class I SAM-dependent methyltransferase family protein [Candidatus Bathyarchaeia archaeon]
MPKESTCIKIPKIDGEKGITVANKLKIVNEELEIKRDEGFIFIPLVHKLSQNELRTFKEQFPNCEISTCVFNERKKQVTTFAELLEDKLPPYLLASLPRALDFVGDIAIIEIPPELDSYKNVVGEAILRAHKNVQTVLAKVGAVSGTYRLRRFEVIAGKPKTETTHKEHGCHYYVDLSKAYFSPRLSYEHKRVASLVKEGETILDLFAGVGPFAILVAKTHEKVKVYAIDVNPYAVEFLNKNIRLNRVEGKVYPILGDARQVVKQKFATMADRVIMNLPEKAIEFVEVACEALKSTGGVIHFYTFVSASKSFKDIKKEFLQKVEKCGRRVENILFTRSVRAIAPYEWQVVLDVKIVKL